jgi:hypothetical protein
MESAHQSQIKKRRLDRRNMLSEKNIDLYDQENLKSL